VAPLALLLTGQRRVSKSVPFGSYSLPTGHAPTATEDEEDWRCVPRRSATRAHDRTDPSQVAFANRAALSIEHAGVQRSGVAAIAVSAPSTVLHPLRWGKRRTAFRVSTSAQSCWSASLSRASAHFVSRALHCPSVFGEITGDFSQRIVEYVVEGGQRIWSV